MTEYQIIEGMGIIGYRLEATMGAFLYRFKTDNNEPLSWRYAIFARSHHQAAGYFKAVIMSQFCYNRYDYLGEDSMGYEAQSQTISTIAVSVPKYWETLTTHIIDWSGNVTHPAIL